MTSAGRKLPPEVSLLIQAGLSAVAARRDSGEVPSAAPRKKEVTCMLNFDGPDDIDDGEEPDWCTGTADFHGHSAYDGI